RLVSTRLELGRGPCRISTRVDSQARSNMDARARYGRRQAPRAAGAASDRHTAHRTLIRLSPAVISLKVNIHDGITRRISFTTGQGRGALDQGERLHGLRADGVRILGLARAQQT